MPEALHIYEPSEAAPAGTKRRGRRLPDFLREDELSSLFKAADTYWRETRQPYWRRARQRDALMTLTAYHCGLRVAELCRLEIEDVDLAGRLLFVHKGKGDKDGTVPLPAKLTWLLREWIGDRSNGVLFPDPRGRHVEISHYRDRLKFLAKLAGIQRRTFPHILRHSAATHLLRRGATIYEVQRFLRHENLSATQVYLHLVPGRLAEIVELL
jgi:site-specific recombinase XerD